MKAVAKLRPENGAMALIDVPEPKPAPGEVLIKITAGGICGTDVAIWKWHEAVVGQYAPNFPLIVGHEFAGIVVRPGSSGRVQIGSVVSVNPQIACGVCEYCALGRPTLCVDRRLMGGRINGGWTELVAVPEQNLYPLPQTVDAALAPLLEPLTVAVHAVVERVPVRSGDIVVVLGAGPIGLLTALLARQAGARDVIITGIAADAVRLALARRLGCIPVNVDNTDPVKVVRALQWDGADIVYETSGNPKIFEQAVSLARRTGRLGLIGLCRSPSTFVTTPVVLRELELIGSRGYNDTSWSLMMRILPGIAADLKTLVTHELKLSEFETALQLVERKEGIKIILRP